MPWERHHNNKVVTNDHFRIETKTRVLLTVLVQSSVQYNLFLNLTSQCDWLTSDALLTLLTRVWILVRKHWTLCIALSIFKYISLAFKRAWACNINIIITLQRELKHYIVYNFFPQTIHLSKTQKVIPAPKYIHMTEPRLHLCTTLYPSKLIP